MVLDLIEENLHGSFGQNIINFYTDMSSPAITRKKYSNYWGRYYTRIR